MSDRLAEILAHKAGEVAALRRTRLPERTAGPPRGFERALRDRAETGFALVAEIKKASPSKGLIRADFHPPDHARAYQAGGAACLSVLTDERFFQGHRDYLVAARAACTLPVLRKDFTIDPLQAAEAHAMGADAILLIVAALEDGRMAEIEAAALDLGLDVLVEVHSEAELDRALRLRTRLLGVNNRDLRDFSVDPARAWALAARAPAGHLIVSESGIAGHADLRAAAGHGIRTFLVGEALMRQPDVTAATAALLTGR
jgi:indole-3-glycerol phosphate synthase